MLTTYGYVQARTVALFGENALIIAAREKRLLEAERAGKIFRNTSFLEWDRWQRWLGAFDKDGE